MRQDDRLHEIKMHVVNKQRMVYSIGIFKNSFGYKENRLVHSGTSLRRLSPNRLCIFFAIQNQKAHTDVPPYHLNCCWQICADLISAVWFLISLK